MANLLGASLDPYTMKEFFQVDGIPHNIYVSLDNCHMAKLIRNNFAALSILQDIDGHKIKWSFIQKLVEFQEKNRLPICPKLNRKHIEFKPMIMKVSLAVQVLSNTVANGLKYLEEDLHNSDFLDSAGTQTFLRMFNDLFDAFNR